MNDIIWPGIYCNGSLLVRFFLRDLRHTRYVFLDWLTTGRKNMTNGVTTGPVHISVANLSHIILVLHHWCPNGGFLKWGYPQIIHFNGIFHYKPTILGYLHLWNPHIQGTMEKMEKHACLDQPLPWKSSNLTALHQDLPHPPSTAQEHNDFYWFLRETLQTMILHDFLGLLIFANDRFSHRKTSAVQYEKHQKNLKKTANSHDYGDCWMIIGWLTIGIIIMAI